MPVAAWWRPPGIHTGCAGVTQSFRRDAWGRERPAGVTEEHLRRRKPEVLGGSLPSLPQPHIWIRVGIGCTVWAMNTGVSCTAGVTGVVTPPVTPDPEPVTGCRGILRPTGSSCYRHFLLPRQTVPAVFRPSFPCALWIMFAPFSMLGFAPRGRCCSAARDRRFVPWDLARSFVAGQGRAVGGRQAACSPEAVAGWVTLRWRCVPTYSSGHAWRMSRQSAAGT